VLHSSEARGNGKWRGAKSELLRLLAARGNGAEAEEARARSRLACGWLARIGSGSPLNRFECSPASASLALRTPVLRPSGQHGNTSKHTSDDGSAEQASTNSISCAKLVACCKNTYGRCQFEFICQCSWRPAVCLYITQIVML
jgi:hypothetical protein